jgi:hypothetical protein
MFQYKLDHSITELKDVRKIQAISNGSQTTSGKVIKVIQCGDQSTLLALVNGDNMDVIANYASIDQLKGNDASSQISLDDAKMSFQDTFYQLFGCFEDDANVNLETTDVESIIKYIKCCNYDIKGAYLKTFHFADREKSKVADEKFISLEGVNEKNIRKMINE